MEPELLKEKRILLVGRLASMSKHDAAKLISQYGAMLVDELDDGIDIVVVGEENLLSAEDASSETLDNIIQKATEKSCADVVSETELWRRIGLLKDENELRSLHTPFMLAELLGLPISVVRRWHRRGLIKPNCEVRRLPYFDFREVKIAKRLAELLSAGVSPKAIEKKLETLTRYLPSFERPLAQLSVIIEGKQILLRQDNGLIEPGGQLRFDFTPEEANSQAVATELTADEVDQLAKSPEGLAKLAAELEESGQLKDAADTYRAAIAAGGPDSELCFQIAEILYRLGDLSGARERYYMAMELDEDYVEARANLGCVLAETGEPDMAIAAFRGALKYHPDYADVHLQLAQTLHRIGRISESRDHWREFLRLAPDSPWADEVRKRLEETNK